MAETPAPSINNTNSTYPQGADNGGDFWMNGVTAPMFAVISLLVASTPQTVVAAVAGKRIRVIHFALTNVTASGTAAFQTSTASAPITGAMAFAANGQIVSPVCKYGLFETATGDGLLLASAGTTNVTSGYLVYVLYTP